MVKVSFCFVIIIAYIVVFFLKNRVLNLNKLYKFILFMYLFCSISVNAGFALKVAETSIGINTFLLTILFVLSIVFIIENKYEKKILLTGVFFVISIILGVFAMKVFPYKGGVVNDLSDWDYIISGSKYIQYSVSASDKFLNYMFGAVRFPIILSVTAYLIRFEDIIVYINKLYISIKYFIVYGYIEFLIKVIFKVDISDFQTFLLGDTTYSYKIQGFTSEASKYAMVLFIYSILIIIQAKIDLYESKIKIKGFIFKKYLVQLILVYLLIVLTTSLSGYYLLIISILVLLINVNVNKKVYIFFSLCTFAVIIFIVGMPNYIIERLGMISQVLSTLRKGGIFHSYLTSEGARLSSIYYAIKAFLSRPIFGVGMGGTDAHSIFFAILANFGLLGTIIYFKIWKYFSKSYKSFIYWLIIASILLAGGFGYFSELYLPFLILAYETVNKKLSS
ncbi:O-antigen ligase family protein [Agathobacter sp.]